MMFFGLDKSRLQKLLGAGPEEGPVDDPFLDETQHEDCIVVKNHPFAPMTAVGFHLAHRVGVERAAGREPFENPVEVAVVDDDGTLVARALSTGQWCAVGEVGDRYRYVQFPVE